MNDTPCDTCYNRLFGICLIQMKPISKNFKQSNLDCNMYDKDDNREFKLQKKNNPRKTSNIKC